MSFWESNGRSDEWFTPPEVFAALGCSFDSDPCPAPDNSHVPAASHSCGKWSGFVWLNPPFGGRNGLVPWLDKFVAHRNGIALVPDRTSAPWFQEYAPQMHSILFTRKLKFIRPDGTRGKSPSNGTALMALGARGQRALAHAAQTEFGFLVRNSELEYILKGKSS